MHEEMNEIIERIGFLIEVYNMLTATPRTDSCVRDSLEHLRSRTYGWRRWLQSFGQRANIRIQLGFHLATQEMGKQTQKDSSCMMAYARLLILSRCDPS